MSNRPVLGVVALVVGIIALIAPPRWSRGEPLAWNILLAPYSSGERLPGDFVIKDIRRGTENDLVIAIVRPDDGATIEVHVLQRGRWSGVRTTRSFAVGYETPHSSAPAADRDAVTEVIAALLRQHDDGLPSPDAIPLDVAAGGSALPWWLDRVRGYRAVAIGASLIVLGATLFARLPALVVGAVALALVDLAIAMIGVPISYVDFGARWTLPVAALLVWFGVPPRRVGSRRRRALAVALFGLALVIRLALGVWGPLHVNGLGGLWVDAAARDPAALGAYGPGYLEIFAPLAALAGENPDRAIFAANAVLSALIAPIAFALALLSGVGEMAAIFAGLLLAVDPVAVQMAATESYFPALVALGSLATIILMAVADDARGERPVAGLFGVFGAALLLAAAARVHPSGWASVAIAPLAILAAAAAGPGNRLRVSVACLAIVAGMIIATSSHVLLDVFGSIRGGTLMQPSLPISFASLAWLAGGALMWTLLGSPPGLVIAAVASLAALLITHHTYDQSWLWQQCYDRLYLTLPVVAAVAIWPARWQRPAWLAAATLVLAVTWLVLGRPIVAARTTDQLEYRWLREQIASLPAGCRVIHVGSAGKRGLFLPSYAGPVRPAVAIDPQQAHTIAAALAPTDCLYYVRSSLCSSSEGRPACAMIESRLELTTVAGASFPARPSHRYFPYDRDPVEVGLSRATTP